MSKKITSYGLNYDKGGTEKQLEEYVSKLSLLSKKELVAIIVEVAESCDSTGKGYVNQFEATVRHDIGYL